MQILKSPANYSGAFGELVYEVGGADPQQVVQIEITGGSCNDLLGIKRFRGQDAYSVNIAPYVRRLTAVEPVWTQTTSVRIPEGRTAQAGINTGGTASAAGLFTAGVQTAEIGTLLSAVTPGIAISRGETDELAVISEEGTSVTFQGYAVMPDGTSELVFAASATGNGNMAVCALNMDSVDSSIFRENGGTIDDYRWLDVYQYGAGWNKRLRRYMIKPPCGGVRLCWLNRYGALDYYTFAICDGRQTVAQKEKVYTGAGYKVYGSEAQEYICLKSEYESGEVLRWLGGVLCSPQVWAVDGTRFVPVDVVTDRVLSRRTEPGVFEITLRENTKTKFQGA